LEFSLLREADHSGYPFVPYCNSVRSFSHVLEIFCSLQLSSNQFSLSYPTKIIRNVNKLIDAYSLKINFNRSVYHINFGIIKKGRVSCMQALPSA
jgi:hypothetical protein